jgi:hypothetical protein
LKRMKVVAKKIKIKVLKNLRPVSPKLTKSN